MRAAIQFVQKKFTGLSIVGAEVGVMQGYNALDILQNILNLRLLYLIDPYLGLCPFDGNEATKYSAKENLAFYDHKICWVYKKFESCTTEDISEPLDFIYIDGDHSYECVKEQLVLAAKLVKKDGVVGGHDFGWTGNDGGVHKAVKEYVNLHEVTLNVRKDGDWWVI